MTEAIGHIVRLPDGSSIPDKKSPTGYVMAPVADLSSVAAAGREIGNTFYATLLNPETATGAAPYLWVSLLARLGHGGTFDYQRKGNGITGFTQLRHFRNVSNVNVGLLAQ